MLFRFRQFAAVLLLLSLTACITHAGGAYYSENYPPSDKPGELTIGVTYTVWIPDGVEKLRGVIVHQHGCGTGACTGGETSAYDLHWQALARKWDCALLGPSYQQKEDQNCRLWCDPRNGSDAVFLRALDDLAVKSGHPELATVPWCLWGHSGGGFWASLMQTLHPDRIVAAWLRSGTARYAWELGEIPRPNLSDAVFEIPTMLNPGVKEQTPGKFNGAWDGSLAMFDEDREKGARIGLAPDPLTGHECGDSRYLAILFFDVCLAVRLPDVGSPDQTLKSMNLSRAWLGPLPESVAAANFKSDLSQTIWLPNEAFANAWDEYVQTGAVGDDTRPPAPTVASVTAGENGARVVAWDAEADFESGLRQFIILRDGTEIGRVPAEPVGRFGRPLFQGMSYHDTPNAPLAKMEFIDTSPAAGPHRYSVVSVNSTELASEPCTAESKE
jgi:hypothetical protein